MNVFVILSHALSDEQRHELQSRFRPEKIMELPEELKTIWMNIPPAGDWNPAWIQDLTGWLEKQLSPGDIAIVQGEFGATYYMVNWFKRKGHKVYYATTERKVTKVKQPDGSVEIKRVFRHVNFREYPSDLLSSR